MIASLARQKLSVAFGASSIPEGGKNIETNFATITKWYGLENPKNITEYMQLPDDAKFYCLRQIRVRYIAVSTDRVIEFFDVLTKEKIGKLEIGGFYSLLLRANSDQMSFEMEDIFL